MSRAKNSLTLEENTECLVVLHFGMLSGFASAFELRQGALHLLDDFLCIPVLLLRSLRLSDLLELQELRVVMPKDTNE